MIVRIGYIGCFGDYHTEWGVSKALEPYARVDRYQHDRMDRELFTERDYDIVLTTLPHSLPPEFWHRQKGIKVAHYFDLVIGFHGREKHYFPALKEFDLVLGPGGFDCRPYENAGIKNRVYFQQGFDPEEHYPVRRRQVRDVGFIGHAYDRRRDVLSELARRYSFEHVGQADEVYGEAHPAFCASSRIMLALLARNDIPGYWSIRVYLHLACRAFVLHPYVEGIEEEFEDGKHLALWRDRQELMAKIDYYLAHPTERRRIAAAGHKRVQDFTWEKRMERFWTLIGVLDAR